MKQESDETIADEAKESPAKQKQEMESGTEEHIIPEDFQKNIINILSKASKHHLSFVRDTVNRREDEIRKDEMKKMPKGKLDAEGISPASLSSY